MDRLHTPRKHGISKMNTSKEHRKLKNTMRHFTMDGSDGRQGPRSSTYFISDSRRKPYKQRVDRDVTTRLLAMVSQTSKVTSAHAVKHRLSSSSALEVNSSPKDNSQKCLQSTELHLPIAQPIVEFHTKISDGICTVDGFRKAQTDGKLALEDLRSDKKRKNKVKVNQGANVIQVSEQRNNYSDRPNEERLLSTMENSFNKQEVNDIGSKVLIKDSLGTRKSIGVLKKMKPKTNSKFKKSNKKHNSSGETKLSVQEEKEVNDKSEQSADFKEWKIPEIHTISSAFEKEHLYNGSNILDNKRMSSTQKKQPCSMKNTNDNSCSDSPQSDKLNKKTNKRCITSDEKIIHIEEMNGFPGEWNVNSDMPKKEDISLKMHPKQHTAKNKRNSLKMHPKQHTVKNKRKKSKVLDIPSDVIGDIHELPNEMISENQFLRTATSFENKEDVGCVSTINKKTHIKFSKKQHKKTLEKEFCDSQAILVEMDRNYGIPLNPINNKIFNLKRQKPVLGINSKCRFNWSSNTCSTAEWEVLYGNTENLLNLRNEDVEFANVLKNEAFENKEMSAQMKNDILHVTNSTESATSSVIENHSFGMHQLLNISETEVILAVPPLSSVFFHGAVKAKVLLGEISVLGYELNSNTAQELKIYSPYGVSCMCFQSCVQNNAFKSREKYRQLVQEKINGLKSHLSIQPKVFKKIPDNSTLILLESVSETLIAFLHKFFPSKHFPSPTSRSKHGDDSSSILKTVFVDPRSEGNLVYKQPTGWSSVTSCLLKHKPAEIKAMVCGGKGVGKSTFLRFLANQMLSKFSEVLYIDFDPGQCEFSTPGCVSAVIVKKPLLGPNFTHLTLPERMVYVGDIDVSGCSAHYIQCVKYIFDWCCSKTHLTKLPWFINTMGFVRGLGLDLAVTIIKLVNPSDVIQIESSTKNRNYSFHLKAEGVQSYGSRLPSPASSNAPTLNYAFHIMPSAAETPDNRGSPWGMQANVARETVLLSYFSEVVSPPAFSLLEVVPYVLPFAGLKLCIGHEKLKYTDYLSAMNGNLVALCYAENIDSFKPNNPEYPEIVEKRPVGQCFGFGIVRGIDVQKKIFYIISPVPSNKIQLINCLVLGSVQMPECAYTAQDEALGTLPYVIGGALLPLGREVKNTNRAHNIKHKD